MVVAAGAPRGPGTTANLANRVAVCLKLCRLRVLRLSLVRTSWQQRIGSRTSKLRKQVEPRFEKLFVLKCVFFDVLFSVSKLIVAVKTVCFLRGCFQLQTEYIIMTITVNSNNSSNNQQQE